MYSHLFMYNSALFAPLPSPARTAKNSAKNSAKITGKNDVGTKDEAAQEEKFRHAAQRERPCSATPDQDKTPKVPVAL